MFYNQSEKERTLIVAINKNNEDIDEDINELKNLANTAGAEVVESIEVKVKRFVAATLIGKGKLGEIKNLSDLLNIDLVIFSMPLSPVQKRNAEDIIGIRVIDRNELIMDIFALHAKTKISRLEVELAQLEYRLTHLTGKGIEMSRTGGGIGTRGPGEQKLETDRRYIRKRISFIKKELSKIDKHKSVTQKKRQKLFNIALAGYTNSGKSTLLKRLTGKEIYIANQLFATLDTSVAYLAEDIIISDTVGFIRYLPPMLLRSFKTTLKEILLADLILFVVDASSKYFYKQYTVVEETLDEIGASKIEKLIVFNKIDKIKDKRFLIALKKRFPDAVFISSLYGTNIDELIDRIKNEKEKNHKRVSLLIPYDKGKILNLIHKKGKIIKEQKKDNGWFVDVMVPISLSALLSEFERIK